MSRLNESPVAQIEAHAKRLRVKPQILCAMAGVSHSQWYRWIKGLTVPYDKTVRKILAVKR